MHIHFGELLVILLVALLVIKPEKLPRVAKKLASGVQWFRRTMNQLKDEYDGKKGQS